MKHLTIVTLAIALLMPIAAGYAAAPADKQVEDAFKQLATYEHGAPSVILKTITAYVEKTTGKPAARRRAAERLAKVFADTKATQAGRDFAGRLLPLVGSDEQVPMLAGLLSDAKAGNTARYALASIPGEASGKAMRDALPKLKGDALIEIVNSLGDRRDTKAVAAIAKLAVGADQPATAAALRALGKIGTPEAADALSNAKLPTALLPVATDSRIRCADLLLAEGKPDAAEPIYLDLWQSKGPSWARLAGLRGLATIQKAKAVPLVLEASRSKDLLIKLNALRLTRKMPGKAVTVALIAQLAKADNAGKVQLLDVLAERGDSEAASAVLDLIDGGDEALRAAAIRAASTLGSNSLAGILMKLAATEKGMVQQAAREGLVRLKESDLWPIDRVSTDAERVELIRAMIARGTEGVTPTLLDLTGTTDPALRQIAFDAIGAIGSTECYRLLIGQLSIAASEGDSRAAEKAARSLAARIEDPAKRGGPVVSALKTAPAKAMPALLRLLAGLGGAEALAALREFVGNADAGISDAAVRAIANWPDLSAAGDLLALAKNSKNNIHRVLALRGYLRLMQTQKAGPKRLKMLEDVRGIATTPDAKKMLLAALGDIPDVTALTTATSFLDDKAVTAEAAVAMLKIAKALGSSARAEVCDAMDTLKKKSKDKAIAGQAEAVIAAAMKPTAAEKQNAALRPDKKRSDARAKELAAAAPKGYRIVGYINCGPDRSAGVKGGPTMRVPGGKAWFWPGSVKAAPAHFGSIIFDAAEVPCDMTALSPKKAYKLGFTWWDFDHGTRKQSVWVSSAGARRPVNLVKATQLPAGGRKQVPKPVIVDIPRVQTAAGAVRVSFRLEGAVNTVLSEVWLMESVEDLPQVAVKPDPDDAGKTQILMITGDDYPGHKWKLTAPALADEIEKDPRLKVTIVEKPDYLASPDIHKYDAMVMHWMNWKKPSPGEKARENFSKFVKGGKGLVIVHFACGAFPDWPEFKKIAGKVYNPKLRGHDPRGKFTVEITDPKHPVTSGMKSFEADDELYTCVEGDLPVNVIATAVSKVDKKVYPMAFAFKYGKGPVLHCVLGHDVKAFQKPGVSEIFRRATAWAAGLPATPPKK